MPKFHVDISVNNVGGYEVEADSEAEAIEKAEAELIAQIQDGTSTYSISDPYE